MFGRASGSITHYANVGVSTLYGYYIPNVPLPVEVKAQSMVRNCVWRLGTGFSWDGAGLGMDSTSINIYCVATVSGTQNFDVGVHIVADIA